MIFEKVIFIETIPTGQYANYKMGVEGTLEPNESITEAFKQAKEKIREAFNAMNGERGEYRGETYETAVTPIQTPKENKIQSIIEQINTVTDLKVLDSYRLIAKSNPEIQTAYDNKLKSLQ